MADLIDEYTQTFLDSMEDEIARRRAEAAKPQPCTTPGCDNHAHKLENGTNTRYCRPCWEDGFTESNMPSALIKDFAIKDTLKR